MEKIYDTLLENDRRLIDNVSSETLKEISNNNTVDLVLLLALLEKLNEKKKFIKKNIEDRKREKELEERKEKEEIGKQYANTLKVGDLVTFKYGTGGKQIATLPLDKIGLKTIQVTYTKEMLPEGSTTAKRNIRFDKIVVPEEFLNSLVA